MNKYTISGIFLFFTLMIFTWYHMEVTHVSGVESMYIESQTGAIVISDTSLSLGKSYVYYQVYAYPKTYELICKSTNKNICTKINEQKNNIQDYQLGYFSKDLSGEKKDTQAIKILDTSENINLTINEVFSMVFQRNTKENYEDIIKYFPEKKENQKQMNQAEKTCLEQILMTVTPGSFGSDEIIEQRVKNECSGLENIGEMTINSSNIRNDNTENISFGIHIKEIKLVYKFFTKSNGKFEEKYAQEETIPYEKKVMKIMNISY